MPGPKVSMENFLSRLLVSVVKGGRVLDIRAGVAEVLHVSNITKIKFNHSVYSLVVMGRYWEWPRSKVRYINPHLHGFKHTLQ